MDFIMMEFDSTNPQPKLDNDFATRTVLGNATPFYANQICDYEVLSPDEIVQYVKEFVRETTGFVGLDTTTTRTLLSHCKWDKDDMVNRFFENPEKLYKEAHVVISTSATGAAIQSDHNECEICYGESSPIMSAESACGHKFCKSCWSEYLKVKIMDEGVGHSLECPASECHVIIDNDSVIELVDDEEAKLRYQQLITNSFVQQNKLMRWCPARGCSLAIKADHDALKPICCYCKCGHEFCFGCGREYHAPVPCDMLERFETKLQLLSDSTSEIKNCPNSTCKIRLQKDDGCPVVKCRNCCTIFCWRCLQCFITESYAYVHKCLDFLPSANDVEEEPAEETSNAPTTQSPTDAPKNGDTNNLTKPGTSGQTTPPLDLMYAHMANKLRLAVTLVTENRKLMQEPHENDVRCKLVELELASLEWVRSCRTLKYSVLFHMCAEDTTRTQLLQNSRKILEEAVVELSQSIERISIDFEETYDDITQAVSPAYKHCQLRRRALLSVFSEELDEELWTFKAEYRN